MNKYIDCWTRNRLHKQTVFSDLSFYMLFLILVISSWNQLSILLVRGKWNIQLVVSLRTKQ